MISGKWTLLKKSTASFWCKRWLRKLIINQDNNTKVRKTQHANQGPFDSWPFSPDPSQFIQVKWNWIEVSHSTFHFQLKLGKMKQRGQTSRFAFSGFLLLLRRLLRLLRREKNLLLPFAVYLPQLWFISNLTALSTIECDVIDMLTRHGIFWGFSAVFWMFPLDRHFHFIEFNCRMEKWEKRNENWRRRIRRRSRHN